MRQHCNKIVAVMDDRELIIQIEATLGSDYELECFRDGTQALESIVKNPPDVVLSELAAPGVDGLWLFKQLRDERATRGIPLIVIAGSGDEESLADGVEDGVDDYLIKPFTARELKARVRTHLRMGRICKEAEATEANLRREAESARDQAVAILSSIKEGFFTLDENWRFTYLNPAAEKLLAVEGTTLLGRDHWELYPALLGTNGEREFRRAMKDKVPVELELLYSPKERWFAINAYPSNGWLSASGGLSVYLRDITKSKKAKQELLESEMRFRQLADNISQLAWMADETGSVFWLNEQWYDYTGKTVDQMKKAGWLSVQHPDHLARVAERFQACIKNGQVWEDTFPLRGKHGQWRWFLSRARPIHGVDGQIVRWFGTNTDITEQLETERDLRRANQDLEQFAFSASHDLQEPLRNVTIYSQLLQRRSSELLDTQSQRFINFIIEGADRMGNLISDLLAYTQAGITAVEPVAGVEAEVIFEDVMAGLAQRVKEAHACVMHTPLPAVAVETVHLQQLLQNLIGNALKYRRDDENPVVNVKAVKYEDFWQFSVEDNGIGIDSQFHDKVFGIFKRLHPKGGKYPGTGIGLAICQRIVERYGGTIWLESEVGKGTSFYFTLPAG